MGTQPKVHTTLITKCLAAVKEARDSERVAPSVTARRCATTSRASPSRRSAVWLVVVAGSASRTSSTKRLVVCSRSSLRASSVTPSPTPSTRVARPSPRWTSSTRSSARAAPSTALVVKHFCFIASVLQCCNENETKKKQPQNKTKKKKKKKKKKS